VTEQLADLNQDSRPTAVYRLYDGTARLLYVGIGYDPLVRWSRHAATTKWWPEVRRIEIEWYDNRAKAEAVELSAIENESPVHNVMHAPTRPPVKLPVRPSISSDGGIGAEEVAYVLGIDRRSVYTYSRRSDFPKPTYLGRTPLWNSGKVKEWRKAHPARHRRDSTA
jgi:predicted DNA-binding transcriptional regulator AlpA